MSGAQTQSRGGSPFSRGAMLAVVLVGFTSFIAMLYFIAIGDTGGPDERGGTAHAATNGLNGYSALVQLLEAEGMEVNTSRQAGGLDTSDLLILTPTFDTDPAEFARILENREYLGPTVVILPKWQVGRVGGNVVEEDREKLRHDWVQLHAAGRARWADDLPEPYAVEHKVLGPDIGFTGTEIVEVAEGTEEPVQSPPPEWGNGQSPSQSQAVDSVKNWAGFGLSGQLPTPNVSYLEPDPSISALVIDSGGRILAANVEGEAGSDYYENAHWTIFVAEPDLMNNYGMADADRAAVALALIREAGYGDMTAVTFDMTLVGHGESTNLLTLAFQPPFLAATLCLLLAMVIIGWRAFMRFGPTALAAPEFAFGKRRLVANGAGLIVRAKRLGLLGLPYVHLVERRLAKLLGIAKHDAATIDAALAHRLPNEEPFSIRAARMENAQKPQDILKAAKALNELTDKLTGKSAR